MEGGAWWAAVHGVAKSWTRLCDFTFTFHLPALEKEMATHSSTLAWRIPWREEPGGLQSMWLQRVGHNLTTKQQQQCSGISEHLTKRSTFNLYTRQNNVG